MKRKKQIAILGDTGGRLSIANVDTNSVSVDNFDFEGFEVVLPTLTFEVIQRYDFEHEVLAEESDEKFWNALDDDERADLIEKFEDTDGYREWKETFSPMMLAYWPVCLPYNADETKIADLIEELSIAISLIEVTGDSLREVVGEDHALVLTGGGMNLADHVFAAYLACGCVPPLRLFEDIKGVIGRGMMQRIEPRLKEAFKDAEGWLKGTLSNLVRSKKALLTGKREGINAHA